MNIILTRHAYLDTVTLGQLAVGDLVLKTLERPWLRNPNGQGGMADKSCVPDGSYTVRPHTSAKFPDTFQLISYPVGVYEHTLPNGQQWGRTEVLIHKANRVSELLGCVAIGLSHSYDREHVVLESRKALDLLRDKLLKDQHFMIIQPTPGTV